MKARCVDVAVEACAIDESYARLQLCIWIRCKHGICTGDGEDPVFESEVVNVISLDRSAFEREQQLAGNFRDFNLRKDHVQHQRVDSAVALDDVLSFAGDKNVVTRTSDQDVIAVGIKWFQCCMIQSDLFIPRRESSPPMDAPARMLVPETPSR